MSAMAGDDVASEVRQAILSAALDRSLIDQRADLARLTAKVFNHAGTHLHVGGWIIGPDRPAGKSPFGNGSDEAVAVALLLRIAAQLLSGATRLFDAGEAYAGSALLRQLVEVEYLAWAFEARNGEGERWLRSDHKARRNFFSPAKLRDAAKGKFRSQDYGYHCEHGGHPVPGPAGLLLNGDPALVQLMFADMLGHAGRIWDHLVGWARDASHGEPLVQQHPEMLKRYVEWKSRDLLANLPPPPLPAKPTA